MLELNSDFLDASKKINMGTVSANRTTDEAKNSWVVVLQDLLRLMHLRSTVLSFRPASRYPQRVESAQIPDQLLDPDMGAPPVVMWCEAIFDKPGQPKGQGSKKWGHQEAVGPASSSSWGSSWQASWRGW